MRYKFLDIVSENHETKVKNRSYLGRGKEIVRVIRCRQKSTQVSGIGRVKGVVDGNMECGVKVFRYWGMRMRNCDPGEGKEWVGGTNRC
jgi:hypothetical protein